MQPWPPRMPTMDEPAMFSAYVPSVTGSKIEKAAVAWAELRGWLCIKIAKTSIRGYPDRVFIREGRHVWVEFKGKDNGERLTTNQERRIADLKEHDADIFVCRCLADFKYRMR